MRAFLLASSLLFAVSAAAQPGGTELERAYDGMVAAQTQLQQAEAARQLGAEPQAGERLGTVGGQSRLSEAYWVRQKRLDEEVDRARERLERATTRWNSLR